MTFIETALALLVVNLLLVALMYYDKQAAIRHGWRVPEANLLLLCLLGGAPAMLFSMRWFRHKTLKQTFRAMVYVIMGLQVSGIFLLMLM